MRHDSTLACAVGAACLGAGTGRLWVVVLCGLAGGLLGYRNDRRRRHRPIGEWP